MLSHHLPYGTEKPVGHVKYTIKSTEVFSDRKGRLALHFCCQLFQIILYVHHFLLIMDPKPLQSLLAGNKPVRTW